MFLFGVKWLGIIVILFLLKILLIFIFLNFFIVIGVVMLFFKIRLIFVKIKLSGLIYFFFV